MKIAIWYTANGWFWDDIEDHGGHDRTVPCGPFETERAAHLNAKEICSRNGAVMVQNEPPLHYHDTEDGAVHIKANNNQGMTLQEALRGQ